MFRFLASFFVFTFFLASAPRAQDTAYREPIAVIDTWIEAQLAYENISGVSPEKFADGIFKILDKYKSTPASTGTVNLADYVGIFDRTDWGSEVALASWKGRLLMYSLPSNDPVAAQILPLFKPTATANEFRFERKDDLVGVPLRFQRYAAGKVVSYMIHGNTTKRVR